MVYRLIIPADFTDEQFIDAALNIPINTSALDLSTNNLNRFSVSTLIAFLQRLPENVFSLNLSSNDFGPFKSPNELSELFTAIPEHVSHLNLSNNLLGNKSVAELTKIFAPLHRKFVRLILKQKESLLEESEFYNCLPKPLKKIAVNEDDSLDDGALWAKLLLEKVMALLLKRDLTALTYKPIHPPLLINENKRIMIIMALAKIRSPLAYLTLGLLSEGRILTYSETNVTQEIINAHMEERTYYAIDFYIEAAKDPQLEETAYFILWHLKTTTAMPRVKQKLDSYDIPAPIGVIESYLKFNTSVLPIMIFHQKMFFSPVKPQVDVEIRSVEWPIGP